MIKLKITRHIEIDPAKLYMENMETGRLKTFDKLTSNEQAWFGVGSGEVQDNNWVLQNSDHTMIVGETVHEEIEFKKA